jgi:hypothetical protein
MEEIQLSLIEQVQKPTVIGNPSINSLLKAIKTGNPILDQYPFVSTIKQIRYLLECGQKKNDKVKSLKLSLPKIFPHVKIEKGKRIGEDHGIFSGYVHYDIDAIKPKDMIRVSITLQTLNPYCLFRSPSGQGFKVFFQTNLQGSTKGKENLFKSVWQAIGNRINDALIPIDIDYKIDASQKSINSGLFLSYDRDLWENPHPSIINIDDIDILEDSKAKKSELVKTTKKSENIVRTERYPKREEILKHIKWMSKTKQNKTIEYITDYFSTPRMEGKRYTQFFKTVSNICVLGISNEIQEWNIEKFRDLLILLDYDGSRKEKDQIEGSLASLKKYGYFENQVQLKENAYTQHLKSFVQPQKILKAKSFVSECHSELLNEISSNIVLAVDSPTGSGKTSWIFKKLINDFQGRILLALPLRSLLSELQSKYQGDERVQFLSDGQKLDPTKKLICCTYEKLLSYQKDLQTSDLLVIDEAHLLGQSFRSNTFRQLVNLVSKKTSKFILLSATMQSFLSALKPHLDIRYVKIETETPQQKKSLYLRMIKACCLSFKHS